MLWNELLKKLFAILERVLKGGDVITTHVLSIATRPEWNDLGNRRTPTGAALGHSACVLSHRPSLFRGVVGNRVSFSRQSGRIPAHPSVCQHESDIYEQTSSRCYVKCTSSQTKVMCSTPSSVSMKTAGCTDVVGLGFDMLTQYGRR